MIALPDFTSRNTPEAYLRTRPDAEIRELQRAYPLVVNGGNDTNLELWRLIDAEGRRRGFW